jgi:S-adenosylmethionine:tRNA ribosyltransferase-isomerase
LANRKLSINLKASFVGGRQRNSQAATFNVAKKSGQFYFLKPSFPLARMPDILKQYGVTPLPPYIKNSPLSEARRRKEYQTVFAKSGLSVAAPTASLHFTKRLIGQLKKQGIGTAFVRLDVNLGTFAPLREEQFKLGKLHREFYSIGKSTAKVLNQAKANGRPIIAVGTTVVRTLESAAHSTTLGAAPSIVETAANNHRLINLNGNTDLFIKENSELNFVDGLITNFHVPKSSLLMLTAAFVGRKNILNLYQKAIKNHFRFFSFGDAMLILPR